jgi:3'5'-cyclic nucleotide phosphodiesterase
VLDEVREIRSLPRYDAKAARRQKEPEQVELEGSVVEELREYVSNIASMYKDNAFHNFEHASHVTMPVLKLLVAPVDVLVDEGRLGSFTLASKLHDHTYGITSDPLTQFACVFSAQIHDVDRSGVPNAQLVNENSSLAANYKGRSVAEQTV